MHVSPPFSIDFNRTIWDNSVRKMEMCMTRLSGDWPLERRLGKGDWACGYSVSGNCLCAGSGLSAADTRLALPPAAVGRTAVERRAARRDASPHRTAVERRLPGGLCEMRWWSAGDAAKMAAFPVSAPPRRRLSIRPRRSAALPGRLGGTPRPIGRWPERRQMNEVKNYK